MTLNSSNLKLMTWNAHSIRPKRLEFFDFLIDNQINICCISETYLSSNDSFFNPNFFVYRLDRDSAERGGGVAVVIDRKIRHILLPCPETKIIEAISLQIFFDNESFILTSVYFPGSTSADCTRIFKEDIQHLTSLHPSHIITGDFNARHTYWGCVRQNQAGKILYEEMCSSQFSIFHSDSPTHFPENGGNPSTLDFLLVVGELVPSELLVHDELSSDHLPLTWSLEGSAALRNAEVSFRDYANANWTRFSLRVREKIAVRPEVIGSIEDVDASIALLSEAVRDAHDEAVPLKQVNPKSRPLPEHIKVLIAGRNMIRRQLQRTSDPVETSSLRTERNRLKRIINQEISQVTNERFARSLEKMNDVSEPPGKKLFRLTKFLKSRNKGIPVLKLQGKKMITNPEKCEALADHFEGAFQSTASTSNATGKRVEAEIAKLQEHVIDESHIEPFELSDLRYCVSRLKNSKAPGPDKIFNRCIKRLPDEALKFLLDIMNSCLRLGYFPDSWKLADIICIQKPGKPGDSVKSYRPISLLSSLGKLFERLMLLRLQMFLRDENVLPSFQFGFRSGRSTVHQLTRVTGKIRKGLSSKKSVGALAVDLQAAFDSIWHDGLVYKLIILGVPKVLVKMIYSYLQGRKFRVRVGGSFSSHRLVNSGVPQGSVLSPSLFNIFVADMPQLNEVEVAQFADDTLILAESHLTEAITKKLERAAKSLSNYFIKWHIRINPQKSEACLFTKKTAPRHRPTRGIRVAGENVEWKSSIKYLGLHLDKRLTFRTHVEAIVTKTERLIRALYPLLSRRSKLNFKNKLVVFKTMFRPMICYGSPVWSQCAKTYVTKLQHLQNKILKTMLNLPRRTPTVAVHESAKVEMFQNYLEKLDLNFWNRCEASIDEDIVQIFTAHSGG